MLFLFGIDEMTILQKLFVQLLQAHIPEYSEHELMAMIEKPPY